MKRKKTIVRPDGSKEIIEEMDEAPAMGKLAAAGQKGDTELAHVNKWEEELLKRLGGAGTRNQRTGLKQFYTVPPAVDPTASMAQGDDWLTAMRKSQGDLSGLPYAQQGHVDASGNWVGPQVFDNNYGYAYDPNIAYTPPNQGGVAQANPYTYNNWQTMSGNTGTAPAATATPATTTGLLSATHTKKVPAVAAPANTYNQWTGNTGMQSTRTGSPANQGHSDPSGIGSAKGAQHGGFAATSSVDVNAGSQAFPYANNPKIQSDFATYFSTVPAGTSQQWAGGTLTKLADGRAQYTDASGQTMFLTADMDLAALYANPSIKAAWDAAYGPQGLGTQHGNKGVAPTTAPVPAPGVAPQDNNAGPYPEILDNTQLRSDYAAYFSNVPAGTTQNWAGGTLTKNADGTATFVDASGASHMLTAQTSLSELYAIPGVKQAWDQAYGGAATGAAGAATTGNGFDIPTNIMPTSGSTGQTYSGLGSQYTDQLMKELMPTLIDQFKNRNQYIDQYTREALGTYQQQLQNYLKDNIPKAISNLANRGIISSTEGNKILSSVMSDATTAASTKGYETAMDAAKQKAETTALLGQLAELGKSSSSTSSSYSQDPTQVYSIIAQLIQSMM